MGLFSKKKPPKDEIPVSQVSTMRGQGIDNNRIIQTLQRDGYSSSQIFEAMNQADMTPAVNNAKPEEIKQERAQEPQEQSATPAFSQPDYSRTSFKQPPEGLANIPSFQEKSPEVEELVESIIEEKWDDIVKDVSKIVEWKNATESKISSLEQDFSNLKDEFDKLHQAVIGKIGEYDKNILNVGAEVKAMEKVFSKVLPVFTEKVNQLADVADSIKKKSK
ncbi:MAG: hypothetical protein ISS25_02245 [Nanoarchaeota archaeon]|nr:hypothetical protein [DPANN group archaeon]MBL7116627.1 hypothetical protein [Nanoarchaeota archaeon]